MLRMPNPGRHRLPRFIAAFLGTAFLASSATQSTQACLGATRIRVRYKGNKAGTLDVKFVGPDFDPDKPDIQGNGTEFSTGKGTQAVIVANTENSIDVACYGEAYVRVIFTDTSGTNGTHSFCHISSSQGA